jgi:CHASE2 domain-containing sensor protein
MDTKVGAMFVPITAGMFWYIGWLPGIATAVITMVFFVGGIYYMRASITKVDS